MLSRQVKIISSASEEQNESYSFEELLDQDSLILLGEPGSGKTYLFKNAAKKENGQYFTTKEFLIYGEALPSESIIYIDALDEFRSRLESQPLHELIKILNRINPLKIRISCRAADWLGNSDLSLFKPYLERNGNYKVTSLQPLTTQEKITILSSFGELSPEQFIIQAKDKEVTALLEQPQTLKMLYEVVKQSQWPKTKSELYEESVRILLKEHNKERLKKQYNIYELKDGLGALCCIMLLADNDRVTLRNTSINHDVLDIHSLPLNSEILIYLLTGKQFISINDDEVTYSHRTIAEYIAARWLAEKINLGFSLRRLLELLGVDNKPMPELRGLYSWLAQSLHDEKAQILIKNDPYGVLMYGDASLLSTNMKIKLLHSLCKLSEQNPRFRGSRWYWDEPLERLGVLSSTETETELLSILKTSEHFQMRTLVLEIILYGSQPSLNLLSTLENIIINSEATYAERVLASKALIKIFPQGSRQVAELIREYISKEKDSLRLRFELVSKSYISNFYPADIIDLLNEYQQENHFEAFGELWGIDKNIPVQDLVEILDNLKFSNYVDSFASETETHREIRSEVSSCLCSMLLKCLNESENVTLKQYWSWLVMLNRINRYNYGVTLLTELKEYFKNTFILEKLFIDQLEFIEFAEERSWLNHFAKVTFSILSLDKQINLLIKSVQKDNTNIIYYRAALYLICSNAEWENKQQQFILLMDISDNNEEMRKSIAEICSCSMEAAKNYRSQAEHEKKEEEKKNKILKKRNADFVRDKSNIESGHHSGALTKLAKVYFSRYSDVNSESTGEERLAEYIGLENVNSALAGLQAAVYHNKLQLDEVIKNYVNNRYYPYAYVVIAGVEINWKINKTLHIYSNTQLELAYLLSVITTNYIKKKNVLNDRKYEWVNHLINNNQDLVINVLIKLATVELKSKQEYSKALQKLSELSNNHGLTDKLFFPLCEENIEISDSNLEKIIEITCNLQLNKEQLLTIALENLKNKKIKKEKRSIYYSICFIFDYQNNKHKIYRYLVKDSSLSWFFVEFLKRIQIKVKENYSFSEEQLVFLIKLLSLHYPGIDRQNVGRNHLSDINRYIQDTITDLSTYTNATAYLESLMTYSPLAAYQDDILSALAQQKEQLRQYSYKQPKLTEVINILLTNTVSNISDLYAFTLDSLELLRQEISSSNTDKYKAFWNEDSYGKISNPKPEESGRDRFIDLLRPAFKLNDIRVEPEGHMAQDKRADIIISLAASAKLPIEVKRDYHADVWTACINQLDRLYARDPEASGYGIYLVFWYGDKRTRTIPTPPKLLNSPSSPEEMELMLNNLIPIHQRHCLSAIVIDVSTPK